MEFLEQLEKKEKPDFLYHASSNKNIEELEPRNESVRDLEEGPVVFATPDIAMASAFLINEIDDKVSRRGTINNVPFMIISNRDLFQKLDKGGTIYKLPGDSFSNDPSKGLKSEWVSKKNIKPIDRTDYDSALEAMLENGLQVYFVDDNFLEMINKIKMPEGMDELIKILQEAKSENQIKNINYKRFI